MQTIQDGVLNLDIRFTPQNFDPFDENQLRDINRKILLEMDDKRLSSLYGFADADVGKLIKLFLPYAGTVVELDGWVKPVWGKKKCDEQMKLLAALLAQAPFFDSFGELSSHVAEKSGISEEDTDKTLHILIAGRPDGPPTEDIYELIKYYILEVAQCQHS